MCGPRGCQALFGYARTVRGLRTILIVEDAGDSRDLYAHFLESSGFRVLLAVDGAAGLTAAIREQPDAIVLDLGLPRIDGWEVARLLKNSSVARVIPIVVLTGQVTDDARDRAMAAGADAYLTKPCRPEELLAELLRHLPPAGA